MSREQDALKSEMIKAINDGGAWFVTRPGNYIKIGYNESDNCMYARECVFRDGALTGKAYSFGTDWFDISMHGSRTDIYSDPDTFRKWEISYDPERGTHVASSDGEASPSAKLVEFCRQADSEALNGISGGYHIDSAAFAEEMQTSEGKAGKLSDILKKAKQNGSLGNLEK